MFFWIYTKNRDIKGQCPKIFDFRFFSRISFPQAHEYPSMAPRFKLFRKFVEIFAAQWAPPVLLTPMTNRKIFIQKSFHYFVRTPLESRVKLKIIFFLQVHFKVKKNLKQNSRDTVPLKVLSNDRGGGMSGINRQAFPSSTSPQIFGKQIE